MKDATVIAQVLTLLRSHYGYDVEVDDYMLLLSEGIFRTFYL